jgi:hypothetical protein
LLLSLHSTRFIELGEPELVVSLWLRIMRITRNIDGRLDMRRLGKFYYAILVILGALEF